MRGPHRCRSPQNPAGGADQGHPLKVVYKLTEQGKLRANRATGKVVSDEDCLVQLMEEPTKKPVPELRPPSQRPRGLPKKEEMQLW